MHKLFHQSKIKLNLGGLVYPLIMEAVKNEKGYTLDFYDKRNGKDAIESIGLIRKNKLKNVIG